MNQSVQRIESIQEKLRQYQIPGWLFYGFRDIDPIALNILGFSRDTLCSRRWFYLVPAQGEPRKLVHRIEPWQLDHLPGEKSVYLEWEALRSKLRDLLYGMPVVAMQYSENNAIPYVSRVDAGTVEWIRSLGTEVVSSANLIQLFEAVLTETQKRQHRKAAVALTRIVNLALEQAAADVHAGHSTSELQIQGFILDELEKSGLVADHNPIVGVNQNSSDCHYSPTEASNRPVEKEDSLLIDLFGKDKHDPGSVYADITWNAVFGRQKLTQIEPVFNVVRAARNRGVEFLRERLSRGLPVEGWEVDDAVRKVIREAGYAPYFVHRVGHSLGQEVHGNGVNFDNLETHDTRRLVPGLVCTIEPGVYLDDFGVRSEINVLLEETDIEVTTPPQEKLLVFD